jgi:hypothetical protein
MEILLLENKELLLEQITNDLFNVAQYSFAQRVKFLVIYKFLKIEFLEGL